METTLRQQVETDRARGLAATLEAENARLRAGIEALAAEMQSDTCPACHAFYAACCIPSVLRALLAEGGE